MKKATYSIVLTPEIKDALEKAAQKDRRSMSSFLEKLIIEYLEKEGIAWESGSIESKPVRAGRPKKEPSKNNSLSR